MGLREFLLKKKPVAILLCLKDTGQVWYPSKLAQASGASYVYVTQWLDKLEKSGWVRMEKRGRLKAVMATEAGMTVALLLDEMVHKMDALTRISAPVSAPEHEHAQSAGRAEMGDGKKKEKEGSATSEKEERKEKDEKKERKD